MLLKITEKCSMGCKHCMNNALPSGHHMKFDIFKVAIGFQKKYGGMFLIISGGEPTEHPDFMKFILYAASELPDVFITVATNGVWMQTHYDEIKNFHNNYSNIVFQVTSVEEYYPEKINLELPVFSLPNVVICTEIEHIYPQGRALDNNLDWESKASKCINIRLMTKQAICKDIGLIIRMMALKGFFCTPQIDICGNIKLGESDLCPVCSSIYLSNEDIINDILNFKCSKCNHINCNLPEAALKILGEI